VRSRLPGLRLSFSKSGSFVSAGVCAALLACAESPRSKDPGAGGSSAGAGSSSGGPAAGGTSAGTSAGTAGASEPGGKGGAGAGAGAGGASGTAGSSSGAGGGAGSSSGASGTGGTAGGGGSGGALGPLALSGLEIEPNPNMTISCFVSWTTPEPATSEVEFGEGDYEFRIRHEELVTEHRVLVIGMHAETTYRIRAVSSNAQGQGSAEGMFETGTLPAGIPLPDLSASDFERSHAGWTLTNIQALQNATAKIVMYDQNGIPVWYFVHGPGSDARGDVSTELLPDGVLVGPTNGVPARLVDLSGEVKWEGPAQSTAQLMSHFVFRTANGNYVVNRELDKTVTNGSTRIDDQRLEEITPELDVVWSWNLFDHVPPSGTKEELCHANHLTFDDAAGVVYYNCRWLGVFKIERATGEILWRLGGSYDETSLGPGDFTFSPPESQFSDAHEPELHADGRMLLYDNGGYTQGGGGQSYHSRVLEYELDQANLTATRIWEFPGDFAVDAWYREDWYTPFWGDADRLPNGNTLITAGVRSQSAASRIFEVTHEGEVVWELSFPAGGGSYKAERLAPPPLVESLP
jgi:hypothetical protein